MQALRSRDGLLKKESHYAEDENEKERCQAFYKDEDREIQSEKSIRGTPVDQQEFQASTQLSSTGRLIQSGF